MSWESFFLFSEKCRKNQVVRVGVMKTLGMFRPKSDKVCGVHTCASPDPDYLQHFTKHKTISQQGGIHKLIICCIQLHSSWRNFFFLSFFSCTVLRNISSVDFPFVNGSYFVILCKSTFQIRDMLLGLTHLEMQNKNIRLKWHDLIFCIYRKSFCLVVKVVRTRIWWSYAFQAFELLPILFIKV